MKNQNQFYFYFVSIESYRKKGKKSNQRNELNHYRYLVFSLISGLPYIGLLGVYIKILNAG
jgi:hypothetical protein